MSTRWVSAMQAANTRYESESIGRARADAHYIYTSKEAEKSKKKKVKYKVYHPPKSLRLIIKEQNKIDKIDNSWLRSSYNNILEDTSELITEGSSLEFPKDFEKLYTLMDNTAHFISDCLEIDGDKKSMIKLKENCIQVSIKGYIRAYKTILDKYKNQSISELESKLIKSKVYPKFKISDIRTSSMLELASRYVKYGMCWKKNLYKLSCEPLDIDGYNTQIDYSLRFMPLKKIGEFYRELHQKFSHVQDNYSETDLQYSFVNSIYNLMKKRNLLPKKSKLTPELIETICTDYLGSPNLLKENEKNKARH